MAVAVLNHPWLSTAGPCWQVRIWVNTVYLRQDSGPFSYSTVSLLVTLPCLREKTFCLTAKSKQADYLNMTSLYSQLLHIILWQPPSLSVNTFVKSDILTAAIWMSLTGTMYLMKTLYKGELPQSPYTDFVTHRATIHNKNLSSDIPKQFRQWLLVDLICLLCRENSFSKTTEHQNQ